MPSSLGGIVRLVVAGVVSTMIGLYIINRVSFLQSLVSGRKAA